MSTSHPLSTIQQHTPASSSLTKRLVKAASSLLPFGTTDVPSWMVAPRYPWDRPSAQSSSDTESDVDKSIEGPEADVEESDPAPEELNVVDIETLQANQKPSTPLPQRTLTTSFSLRPAVWTPATDTTVSGSPSPLKSQSQRPSALDPNLDADSLPPAISLLPPSSNGEEHTASTSRSPFHVASHTNSTIPATDEQTATIVMPAGERENAAPVSQTRKRNRSDEGGSDDTEQIEKHAGSSATVAPPLPEGSTSSAPKPKKRRVLRSTVPTLAPRRSARLADRNNATTDTVDGPGAA